LSHNGNGQQVAVLEKAMRLSEDVIRYLTVKQEGPLPAPRIVPGSEPEPVQQQEAAAVEA
ncbi:MAG: 30S ribosomal protein S6, partial [Cyanobacteriota bacterium]|nr:30S ribosomal protein S6 [Cyanobacteriota bacterium]